jgi:hypothetical protein
VPWLLSQKRRASVRLRKLVQKNQMQSKVLTLLKLRAQQRRNPHLFLFQCFKQLRLPKKLHALQRKLHLNQ